MRYKIYDLLPSFGTNTYLIWDEASSEAMLIDMANVSPQVVNDIKQNGLKLKYLINTHGHGDHIGGNVFIKQHFEVPLCIHKEDAHMLLDSTKNLSSYMEQSISSIAADKILENGEVLMLGDNEVKVIHTPGHTQGGICIQVGDLLISGDTLFADSVGRTDLPGGDFELIKRSIQEKLFVLPDETIVLPGHGPASTIGEEKIANPFVGVLSRL